MGLAQVIGTLLAQGAHLGTIQTPNEEISQTVNGYEHTVEFVAPWADVVSVLPLRYAQDPTYGGLFLMEGHAKKWMGNLVRVTLSYRTPDYPITSEDGTPPDEFQEQPSAQQESIVLNTNFHASASPQTLDGGHGTPSTASPVDVSGQFAGFTVSSPDYGQNDFYQGCKTIVHTSYTSRLSASLFETTINDPPDPDAYVVICSDMPGDYDGSGNHYLRLTSEVNPAGLWWTKKNTYLYRATPWSTNAYTVE